MIYLTVNLPVTSPQTTRLAVVWVYATRADVVSVDLGFIKDLFQGRLAYLGQRINREIDLIEVADRASIEQLRFRLDRKQHP